MATVLTLPAAAQEGTLPPPPLSRDDPLQGFWPLIQAAAAPFGFQTFLRLDAEYNDNFFLSERNKREEFRETLTPGILVRLARGRSFADLAYAPSVAHSSVLEDLQVFHSLNANASVFLTERLALNVSDRFLRSDVPALTDPRGTRRDRAILTQNVLAVSLPYLQETWSLTPRYDFTINRNETQGPAQPQAEDRGLIHTIGIDGTKDVLGRTTVGAGYELIIADFKLADDFVGHTGRVQVSRQLGPRTTARINGSLARREVEGGNDFDIYRAEVGGSHELSARYAMDGRVGYNAFRTASGADADGFAFSLRGTYTGQWLLLWATAGQSLQETFVDRNNVGVVETREGNVQLQYEATARLKFTLGARVSENRFLQQSSTTPSGIPANREDLLMEANVDVAFQLARRMALTLGYAYTTVDSNLRGFDYDNNRVRVGLSVTYP